MNSAVLVADRIRMSHRGSLALAAAGAILLSAKVVCVKLPECVKVFETTV